MPAVIFDMDGVLTDSEPLILAAAIQMFAELGVTTAKAADFHPFIGTGEDRFIGGPAAQYGITKPVAEMKARTYEIYLQLVPGRLQAFPGARTLVHALKAAGYQVAVASSADRIKVHANLHEIDLPPALFGAVLTGERVTHKKPAPDIFLAAAQELGLPPAQCLVIEDAVTGVQAARSAGMRVIAVCTSFTPDRLATADLVKPALADVTLAEIHALLAR